MIKEDKIVFIDQAVAGLDVLPAGPRMNVDPIVHRLAERHRSD
jgi:hypothetical protein